MNELRFDTIEQWAEAATSAPRSQLSEAGLARRSTMRVELVRAVDARRRRRKATRLATVFLLLAGTWSVARTRTAVSPPSAPLLVERIHDKPSLLDRWSIETRPIPESMLLDDDQLLDLLERHGRASGLIRTGEICELTENVVDA